MFSDSVGAPPPLGGRPAIGSDDGSSPSETAWPIAATPETIVDKPASTSAPPKIVVRLQTTSPCTAPPARPTKPAPRPATQPPMNSAMSGAITAQIPANSAEGRKLRTPFGSMVDRPTASPNTYSNIHNPSPATA